MACTVCSRRILEVFIRGAARVDIVQPIRPSPARPVRIQRLQCFRTAQSLQLHRPLSLLQQHQTELLGNEGSEYQTLQSGDQADNRAEHVQHASPMEAQPSPDPQDRPGAIKQKSQNGSRRAEARTISTIVEENSSGHQPSPGSNQQQTPPTTLSPSNSPPVQPKSAMRERHRKSSNTKASPESGSEAPKLKKPGTSLDGTTIQEPWRIQKEALEVKFGKGGWNPRKRLSPDTLDEIRSLYKSDPERYSTPVLADHFQVSPEAIRRILKSKWRPSEGEKEDRRRRWDRRGERIWGQMVELGIKPPKKWRDMGVGRAAPGELPKWKQKRAALVHPVAHKTPPNTPSQPLMIDRIL